MLRNTHEINRKQTSSEEEDDIPLSNLKIIPSSFKSSFKTKKKKHGTKSKQPKKKTYNYYKGKKVFTKSDSESSDFEKYTYFDEGKTKRKIKLDPKTPLSDIKKMIKEIKMENICLMKERERMEEVKLRERMRLREEIIRLKNGILNLELQNHIKKFNSPTHNNTPYGIIEQLKNEKDILGSMIKEGSVVNLDLLRKNVESFVFTTNEFWKDFNNIEALYSTHGSYWSGDLNHITPKCDNLYKPSDEVVQILSLNNLVENYPYDYFTWNEKPRSKRRKEECTSDKIEVCSQKKNMNNQLYNRNTSDCFKESEEVPSHKDAETQNENEIVNNDLTGDKDSSSENDSISHNDDTMLQECNEPDDFHNETDAQMVADLQKDNNDEMEEEGLCCECGKGTSWSSFISRHREAYQKNIPVTPCNTCNIKFLKSGHFDGRHRLKRPRPAKYRPATFMCSECGERCTSKSGLTQHALKHKEAQYACQLCNYKCRRKSYLKIHMKVHNVSRLENVHSNCRINQNNEEPQTVVGHFACSYCSYTTSKSSSLKSHLNTHTNKKKFTCSYCEYSTSSKSYLTSHINYHTGFKAFKCDKCSYQSVTSTRMNVHKKIHDGIKDYACSMCEYRTTSNFNLKVHFKRHERDGR